MATAPESNGDPTANSADTGKQGILSFFQDTRTQQSAIEVIDSEEEEQQPLEPEKPEQDKSLGKKALASIKKQEIQKERDIKKRQREEEKQRREEQKEEDRRRRQRQKEDQREKREELKRQKELEKRQREEERLKKDQEKKLKEKAKERSQARIGNFFKKVNDSSKQANVTSDYDKFFLPFYAKEGVTVNQTTQLFSPSKLHDTRAQIDSMMDKNDGSVTEWLETGQGSVKTPRNVTYTAVALLQQMTSKENTDQELQDLLSLIPQKYIKFYENVRPPYMGTYSKNTIPPVDNPFSTKDTGYNYDYDSDLEWVNEEDDEEGGGVDDLESGEEDEEEDEDEEASEGEFDGFLDAEDVFNHGGTSKRKYIGPLIPTVCLRTNQDAMQEDDRRYFDAVSIQYLIADQPFPIDPIHYTKARGETCNAPKRPPGDSQRDSCSSPSLSPEKRKIKSLISEPKDLLKLFDEIQDSTFSLGTVTEIAQKNLPFYSKQMIKNTVKEYAARSSGKGEAARKWTVKDTKHWEYLRSACGNN